MAANTVKSITLFICALLGSAYICLMIILFWPQQATYTAWPLFFYHAGPWLLLYLSIKGWNRSRVWRRMLAKRYAPPSLSRGEHRFNTKPERPHILERICLIFLGLSVWALWKIWF